MRALVCTEPGPPERLVVEDMPDPVPGDTLVVGFAAGEIPKLPANLALLEGASIVGVFWGDHARREPGRAAADLVALFQLLRDGKLRPHVSQTFPLERGAQAIRALLDRTATGKLVITMP